MRSIEDLRLTLVEHESLAPEADGMIEAARAGAVVLRRRRRMVISGCVALLAVLVGLAPAVGIRLLRDGKQGAHPAASTTPGAYRKPYQMTLGLAATKDYDVVAYGIIDHDQYYALSVTATVINDSSTVQPEFVVHDPGTYDASALLAGQRITAAGHPAYYSERAEVGMQTQANSRPPNHASPAIGWQDDRGAWVVVWDAQNSHASPDQLTRVAGLVRLGPPRDVRTPFHFGYLPASVPFPTIVNSERQGSELTLAATSPNVALNGNSVMITVKSGAFDGVRDYGTGTLVNGYRTWYFEDGKFAGGKVTPGPGSSTLEVDAGDCYVKFLVGNRNTVPYDELVLMLSHATFADCKNQGSWLIPMG